MATDDRAQTKANRHLGILDLKTETGQSQQFDTTDEHPFYSLTADDWIPAGELEPGDQVIGPTGEIQRVAATHRDEHREGVTVYNFEVVDFHSYYVQARGARAPPVLVHNAKDCGTLVIDYRKHPELADNIWHAQQAGHPKRLTVGGSRTANRKAALEEVPNAQRGGDVGD